MLLYDVNPALAAAQSMSILHKTFGFMTQFTDAHATEQNKSHPHSRKGLRPDLQDAMIIAFC